MENNNIQNNNIVKKSGKALGITSLISAIVSLIVSLFVGLYGIMGGFILLIGAMFTGGYMGANNSFDNVLSDLFTQSPLFVSNILLGIVALLLGILGKKKDYKKLSIAGIVIGIVSLIPATAIIAILVFATIFI